MKEKLIQLFAGAFGVLLILVPFTIDGIRDGQIAVSILGGIMLLIAAHKPHKDDQEEEY